MSRTLRAGLALGLVGAGVLLLLFALDVRRLGSSFRASDLAFADQPREQALWRPEQVLPFAVARKLLGVGDDLAYRRSVQLFRASRASASDYLDPQLEAGRGRAQIALTHVAVTDPDPTRRSSAENLLGVIAFASAIRDQSARATFLENSAAAFQSAIKDDPENDFAKYNLELALAWLQATDFEGSATSGGRQRGEFGGGAGAGSAGSGY